jgi:hypothetical protein
MESVAVAYLKIHWSLYEINEKNHEQRRCAQPISIPGFEPGILEHESGLQTITQ